MSAEHNHAPRCCCVRPNPHSRTVVCPACPDHGALACTCGSTYATYEGPERDCPTHGECAPYPIALASYHETYEPVGTMRIPNR